MMIWQKNLQTFFIFQYGDQKGKTCQMTGIKNCTLQFDKKMLPLNFVSMQLWTGISLKSSNESGSQIHAWILLKKILLYQNLFYFLQGQSFSPWMACFN